MKEALSGLPDRLDRNGVRFQGVDWGELNISYVHLPGGADARPLLEGLPDGLCQAPHWGYVLKGSIHVTYKDGHEETVHAGEVYHWPAGHTVRVDEDYEAIELSPKQEMGRVLDHLAAKLG